MKAASSFVHQYLAGTTA